MINVNFNPEINTEEAEAILKEIARDLGNGSGDLSYRVNMAELAHVKEAAAKIRDESEVLVCIGIGGSYLGHRAVIETLRPKSDVEIVYAGNSLSERELKRALEKVGERDFSINVISKSGDTVEVQRAFGAFRKKLVEKYGEEAAADRIYVTTGDGGALRAEAEEKHYRIYPIKKNVGGRCSVLTTVGLLPMVVAGVDVDALLAGAAEADVMTAVKYAYMRDLLRRRGYNTEVFASFEPATWCVNEWLKQLFGESEGKNAKAVLPVSLIYTTDLHSMGQYMQEGRRDIWETIINYPTDEMNAKVVTAVRIAHAEGGLPVLCIDIPSYDEKGIGEMLYFFGLACAVSAKLAGVNPFGQPGVERYKQELKKIMEAK